MVGTVENYKKVTSTSQSSQCLKKDPLIWNVLIFFLREREIKYPYIKWNLQFLLRIKYKYCVGQRVLAKQYTSVHHLGPSSCQFAISDRNTHSVSHLDLLRKTQHRKPREAGMGLIRKMFPNEFIPLYLPLLVIWWTGYRELRFISLRREDKPCSIDSV